MSDDRLIVALDVPNVVQGLDLAGKIGDAVSFYKIGLGMLTGGGLALANELKQEHGKRIFLDMKFFDIGATVEAAVYQRERLDVGHKVKGPAVIEQLDSTLVVHPGQVAAVDRFKNLLITEGN